MWNFLSSDYDKQILCYLVRACQLLSTRMLQQKSIKEAHELLVKILILIEKNYDSSKITSNMHLALHLKECCYDYGPLYAFWCFPYKRMNGLLGMYYNNYHLFIINSYAINF